MTLVSIPFFGYPCLSNLVWNKDICGEIVTELIHDGLSSEFVTHGYKFDTTQADRWVEVLPKLNSHAKTYSMKLRIKFKDPDYVTVFTDVPFTVEVLPCEIKRTVTSGAYGSLPIYTATISEPVAVHTSKYAYDTPPFHKGTIVVDTTIEKSFPTKMFDFGD